MAVSTDNSNNNKRDVEHEEDDDEERTFEELGEGKDLVARAKTGSGKTYAYLLPLLQKLFSAEKDQPGRRRPAAPPAIVLVPTRELCHQVHSEASSLIEYCRVQLKVVQLTSGMANSELSTAMEGPPDVLVSTPACISTCLSKELLRPAALQESLSFLVLDEADLLLSYGYEDDLKALIPHVPRHCQCLLMSATSSSDIEKLKKLVLHNPVILTLAEAGNVKDELIPKNVQQFWISCSNNDKLLHILALLKFELVQKKVLIFVNTIDMGFKLKLFLEQFGIKSAVLNAELPQNSRLHILEEFNAGLFDYLIASDDSQIKDREQTIGENHKKSGKSKKHQKPKLDTEFGVVRGIDFKHVFTVSPDGTEVFEEIKSMLGDDEKSPKFIAPFPLLTKNAVESLRYRAEDVGKSVTKIAVRESRAQDLRNEILNSEKLKSHFQENPKDLDLLKHDKELSKKPPPHHLRDVPDYLVDRTTQEASKIVKLSRAAMGITKPNRRPRLIQRSGKSRDPLRTYSAEQKPRRAWKGEMKRNGKDEGADGQKNRKRMKKTT
ncbi:DEAD-box ATP-dependent RNA helicase 16 [Acorus calamus]|uniref:RNA helicase n=1 Tax=Acorus calamus TaxID=4465 RepID=A0AAV9FFY0_ACOCL|nr:DEAD-box ATP-dependent RNA helicase 16 [Acorus calamus]